MKSNSELRKMIAIALGTKAELIKTMPVMKELEKQNIDYVLIHTGQHDFGNLLADFELRNPDYVLYDPPKSSSRFMVKTHKAIFWGLALIPKLHALIRKIKPKFVLYHGDTLSTACASIASSKLLGNKQLNGHLEAGLRSGSIFEPYPEEISRKIADRFSDLLFAPSEGTAENLRKEKQKGKIFVTGNTIVDSVLLTLKIAKKKRLAKPEEKEYVVVNVHRHENIKSKERMRKIADIINSVSLPIHWPLHDNTKQQLVKFGLFKKLEKKEIIFSPLKSYTEFIWLLKHAKFLLTDGGSIQEESLALKKPCILLRMRTERVEGLATGLNYLTKLNVRYAKQLIQLLENDEIKVGNFKNPYGDGRAAKRIVRILQEHAASS